MMPGVGDDLPRRPRARLRARRRVRARGAGRRPGLQRRGAPARCSSGVHAEGAHYARLPRARALGLHLRRPLLPGDAARAACSTALARVARATAGWNLLVSVGVPLVVDDLLFNCAVTLYRGRAARRRAEGVPAELPRVLRAALVPARGRGARATRSTLLGDAVPFGTDVLRRRCRTCPASSSTPTSARTSGCRCRRARSRRSPGATVLANLSASNVTVGKWEYRQELVRSSAAKNLAVQLYSAAGFGESTADLAWDGHGLIAERGELVAETERFALAGHAGRRRRRPAALLAGSHAADARSGRTPRATARPFRRVAVGAGARTARRRRVCHALRAPRRPHPFVPADPAQRDVRCREIFLIKATSLARRLRALPAGRAPASCRRLGRPGLDPGAAGRGARHRPARPAARATSSASRCRASAPRERTYDNACALVARARRHAARDRHPRASQAVFAAIGHDAARRGPHLRERAGVDAQDAAVRDRLAGARHRPRHRRPLRAGARLRDLRRRPHVALRRQRRRAEDAGLRADPLGGGGDLPRRAGGRRRCCATSSTRRSAPSCCRPAPAARSRSAPRTLVGPYELHDFFLYHFLRFGFGPRRIARMALPPSTAATRSARSAAGSSSSCDASSPISSSATACPTRPRSAPAARSRRAATGACRPTRRAPRGSPRPRAIPEA